VQVLGQAELDVEARRGHRPIVPEPPAEGRATVER
ncbi:MAG: hypothetical protein QOI42_277, partial [Frankiaceae bacterium]|jgi:hypothetical protein|nr:hypothetical protein [Frankiaceae bacterium]